MKKSIPFIVIFIRKHDKPEYNKNWLPKNFWLFLGFLFLLALAVIYIGVHYMHLKLF